MEKFDQNNKNPTWSFIESFLQVPLFLVASDIAFENRRD